MDKDTYDLLYTVPSHVKDEESPQDLSIEDIPWERVPQLKVVMHGDDLYIALQAALLLCHWANDDGFEWLRAFVCDRPPLQDDLMPHHLRGYDDTYKHVLDAITSYWAIKSDAGFGKEARKKLLCPVLRIIGLSNHMQFGLEYFFWLVRDKGFTEYLPALKAHFTEILKNPKFHHWKIADCGKLLMKFDPEFVAQALAVHGKTLADYPGGI